MTPLYGVPVAMPAELVGVMRPVTVVGVAMLLASEVTVGRMGPPPLWPGAKEGVPGALRLGALRAEEGR